MNPDVLGDDRPRLVALAYRLLGERGRAEELVQEALLRAWRQEGVERPRAWVTTVLTRLCVDELRSARRRREVYPGPWLPEPWVAEGPDAAADRTEALHLGFLVLLERLPPAQRAALVLREVLDEDYVDVAAHLGTSPANARQLVARARARLREAEVPLDLDAARHTDALLRFGAALQAGDAAALRALLTDDCVALSDGGGVVNAAKVPIVGADRVAKAYLGLSRGLPDGTSFELVVVNGLPGIRTRLDGVVRAVLAVGLVDGRIARIWSVLAPEKLRRAG